MPRRPLRTRVSRKRPDSPAGSASQRSSGPAVAPARPKTSEPSPGSALDPAQQQQMPMSAEFMAAQLLSRMPAGSIQRDMLRSMQGIQGNRAVAALVQREDPPGTATATPTATPGAAAPTAAPAVPADLQAFRDRGKMPADEAGTTVRPPGGYGAFQARYDPVAMALHITLNVGVTFVNGMTMSGGLAVAGDTSLNAAALRINALPAAERQAEIDKWTWNGDEEAWMTGYKANVTAAWNSVGTGLAFQSSKPGWESQLANVNIHCNTQNVTVFGPLPAGSATIPSNAGPTHCNATIYKTPADSNDFGAAVGGRDASGTTSLSLGSGQTVAHGHMLRQSVNFDRNSTTLNATATQALQDIIFSFQSPAAGAGTTIDITGHADTSGGGTPAGDARNVEISQKRAQVVADYLKATRVSGNNLINATARIQTQTGTGSAGEGATASSRRVDIVFAGGQGQNVAAHEFGHMLGLDDQYAIDPAGTQGVVAGTGGAVGTGNADDARSVAAGTGRSIYENNDNMMSLGSTVRSPHYVTMMEALRSVTGSTEWKMKA